MKKLARSASRRSKTPTRFQYDIRVDRATGLRPGSTYYLKWTRGVKVATTSSRLCKKDPASKRGIVNWSGEKLSLIVTLYRDGDGPFDNKDSKISIISKGKSEQDREGREKTVGKVHFDLSALAGVPSASTKKSFKLGEKITVIAFVDARFLKAEDAGSRSGKYAGSVISGISGVSASSSIDDFDDDDVNGNGDVDDFADLNVDDVPEPASVMRKRKSSPRVLPKKKPSGKVRESPTSSVRSSGATTVTASASPVAPPLKKDLKRKVSAGRAHVVAVATDKASGESEANMLRTRVGKLESQLRLERDKVLRVEKTSELMTQQLKEAREEIVRLKDEREKAADADTVRLKEATDKAAVLASEVGHLKNRNTGLEKRIDTLMVAAAKENGDGARGDVNVENILADMRREKESLEKKLTSFQKHSVKVKKTYNELTNMYNHVREENVDLKNELEKLKTGGVGVERQESQDMQQQDLERQVNSLKQELSTLRRERDDGALRLEALTRSNSRLKGLMDSLKEKLVASNKQNEVATREMEDLRTQLESENRTASNAARSTTSASDTVKNTDLAFLQIERDRAIRELERAKDELAGMAEELEGVQNDLKLERSEYEKLRKKYDALIEEGHTGRRGYSDAAGRQREITALERKLSTQKRERVNAENTIEQLREEVRKLQKRYSTGMNGEDAGGVRKVEGEIEEVVSNLVATKLKLAEAEDEKLRLQLSIKQIKRHERGIQEKLAEHASSLEVKLGEMKVELSRYKAMEQRGELPDFDDDDALEEDSNDDYEPIKR